MEWLFERMIELGAWVAFVLGLIFLFDAGYLLVQWGLSMRSADPAPGLLIESGKAAAAFVLSSLALGALACIDRYVFDLPEQPAK